MQTTINSRTLGRRITFSRPGNFYIFADINGREGTLGDQICRGGKLTGSTIEYSGDDDKAFRRVCVAWYRAYIRSENHV